MDSRAKIVVLILFALTSFTQSSWATTTQAARPYPAPPANQWMRAMEASVSAGAAVRVPGSRQELLAAVSKAAPSGGLFAWSGWIFAIGFLAFFFGVQFKGRRRERLLSRGTDLSLLRAPGGVERRRKPRH